MSGINTGNHGDHFIRANLWSQDIKEILLDELFAMRYVDMITDFPDGTTWNIPSLGQPVVNDYAEGQAVVYNAVDSGNFTFTISKYKSSATHITEKFRQDSMWAAAIEARFAPDQARAIMKAMEVDLLKIGPNTQTAANTNTINGAYHRFVASGTNQVIALADFAKARYALQKANVPMTNLIAIVDPSVEFTLSTLTNLVNVSNNPMWEGIVRDGMSTGMRFRMNVYGFDVYTTDNLLSGLGETIDSVAVTNGVANLFFSAAPGVMPFIGAVRQPPKVDSEFNKDLQREEYITTARYDFALFRPENLVVVISDNSQVYA